MENLELKRGKDGRIDLWIVKESNETYANAMDKVSPRFQDSITPILPCSKETFS